MAIIFNPKRWTTQPPIGARINFGHPLAVGLTFYALYNAGGGLQKTLLPANLPETAVGSMPSPNWYSGPDAGKSHKWDGNWGSYYQRGLWVEPPNAVTCVTRLRRIGNNPSYSVPIIKTWKNVSNPTLWSYGLEYNRAGAGQDVICALISTASTNGGVGTTVTTPTTTTNVHTTGMRYTSGALDIFFNGIKQHTDAGFTGAITYDTGTTSNLIISGAVDNAAGNEWTGDLYYAAVWNRVLSSSEMEWLHAEPYAMMVPQARNRFFMTAAASRAFTYNVAAEKII